MDIEDFDSADAHDAPTYYCTRCERECFPRFIDEGIGEYEYWGAKGVDVRIVVYSDCCDANATTTPPEEKTRDA